MSGTVRPASGYDECPVRMFPVEVTVLIDHFRLDPDAELQSHCIDFFSQLPKGAAQLLLVDLPVSQTSHLTVPAAKPSIVHDEHLDPQVRRLFRQFQKGVPGKVKIERLPAVQEDRTHSLFILAPAQVSAHTAMQVL